MMVKLSQIIEVDEGESTLGNTNLKLVTSCRKQNWERLLLNISSTIHMLLQFTTKVSWAAQVYKIKESKCYSSSAASPPIRCFLLSKTALNDSRSSRNCSWKTFRLLASPVNLWFSFSSSGRGFDFCNNTSY